MKKIRPSYIHLLASFLTGLLLWLAWPERGFFPLIFIAFVPLLFTEHALSMRTPSVRPLRMFGNFYLSMLTWNVLTTWWIWNSTDVGSLVAMGLNSLFMAIILQLFFIMKRQHGGLAGYTSLVIFWIAFEYLHFNWDISWPWLTLGNVFATSPSVIQWYEYTGVLGGSLWILVSNILVFQLIRNFTYNDLLPKIRKINGLLLSGLLFLIIVLPLAASIYMYSRYEQKGEPVEVVLLQPNVDPYNEKFSGTSAEQLQKMLPLAASVTDSNTRYVIAPETALPDGIWQEGIETHPAVTKIRKFLDAYPDLNFIIGLTSYRLYHDSTGITPTARKFRDEDMYFDIFNSAMRLKDDELVQLYHKSKLVPGVEQMPYPAIFGFLEKFALKLGGTSGSLGKQRYRISFTDSDGTKVAPAICYESIYGDFMSGYMRDGAEFIAVLTNDGWWGDTPGYRQHMQYARLRAVEFRKSIARSANTGISCFINQRGDVLSQTGWWEEAVLKETILKNKILTFYARHGDIIGFACAFLASTMIIYLLIRRVLGRD